MYQIQSKIAARGFYVQNAGRQVFETSHKFGFLRTSMATIGGENITIKAKNLIGSLFAIVKSGAEIGHIDFRSYLFTKISLRRNDGSMDHFKFAEDGFSSIFNLSYRDAGLIKFTASLNPIRLNDLYDVEVLSDEFPPNAIEELIFYAGEILFRQISSNVSTRM